MAWFSILPSNLAGLETWLVQFFVRDPLSLPSALPPPTNFPRTAPPGLHHHRPLARLFALRPSLLRAPHHSARNPLVRRTGAGRAEAARTEFDRAGRREEEAV